METRFEIEVVVVRLIENRLLYDMITCGYNIEVFSY